MNETALLDVREPTLLESGLRSNRLSAAVGLLLLPLVSWTWIVVMAEDMRGAMTGSSAWMMTANWDARHLLVLWAMWAVMMAGMMLPSASPALILYGVVARRSAPQASARQIYALAGGYLLVWTLFSLGATALQRVLAASLLISPMMTVTNPNAGAVLLLIAGAYQLTPFKRACLEHCRSPLKFLMSHWRTGPSAAFRMGLEHGCYCVGCCWALMLLLFAGGVMNLTVIAALTAFVAFEKLVPFGLHSARISGMLLISLGLWLIAR